MFSSKDLFFTPAAGGYTVSKSLRFRSSASAYLSRTAGTATNTNKWTWSGWVKRGQLGAISSLFGAWKTTSGVVQAYFQANDTFRFFVSDASNATSLDYQTTAVYRDPAAFYHVVISFDNTGATASALIYINGTQVTSFVTSANTLSQNSNNSFNLSGNPIYVGVARNTSNVAFGYLDGYLAEVNFIDGQALTPSSFGAFDTNGVWQPAKYTGSYGTNGFYLPFSSNTSAETLAYDFSNTNSELISNGMFVSNVTGWTATGSGSPSVTWQSNHTMRLANSANNAPWAYTTISTVIGQTYYAQAYISAASIGGSTRSIILKKADDANYSINSVDVASTTQGSAPIGLAGTFTATATTTYIIIFADVIGAGTTGVDISQVSVALGGYKKSWNPFNISVTSGTTYDSMIDSPTNYADGGNGRGNYAVLNPINGNSGTFSAANLQFVGPTNWSCVPSTILIPSTGKWFVAATFTGSASGNTSGGEYAYLGVAPPTVSKTAAYNSALGLWIGDTGWVYNFSATGSNSGSSFSVNNEVLFAVDRDANTYAIYKNGSSVATGTIGTTSGADLMFVYGSYSSSNGQMALNFGQRPLANAAPSGFSALNTQNLPTPTIAAGNKYFDATTYTGNSSTQSITNSGSFQPDLVWIKNRSISSQHVLTDGVRGTNYQLFSSLTNAEQNSSTGITAFNSNGFSLGSNVSPTGDTNSSPNSFIAWQWNAGGSTVSNTSGSITSSVRANTSAGFSVVTYTGTLSAAGNATVGHGLGVAPSLIISKSRSAAADWCVQIPFIAQNKYLVLNTTVAQQDSIAQGGGTLPLPNSTTFGTSYINGLNISGQTFVAYCFAPVAGYSAFGSYVGNGSSTGDGPMVYLGFRPRFIMIKASSTGGAGYSWWMLDTTRSSYNQSAGLSAALGANLPDIESSGWKIDVLSNGFKIRDTLTSLGLNATGVTYVYACFAENPFKTSRAF